GASLSWRDRRRIQLAGARVQTARRRNKLRDGRPVASKIARGQEISRIAGQVEVATRDAVSNPRREKLIMPTNNPSALTRTEAQAVLGKALLEIQGAREELEEQVANSGGPAEASKDRIHFIGLLKNLDLLIRPIPVFHHCPDDSPISPER